MEKNCSTCLHARSHEDSECVAICLNAGTFVYDTESVSACPGYMKIPSLRELQTQTTLRMAI